jgi:hypothetical protein
VQLCGRRNERLHGGETDTAERRDSKRSPAYWSDVSPDDPFALGVGSEARVARAVTPKTAAAPSKGTDAVTAPTRAVPADAKPTVRATLFRNVVSGFFSGTGNSLSASAELNACVSLQSTDFVRRYNGPPYSVNRVFPPHDLNHDPTRRQKRAMQKTCRCLRRLPTFESGTISSAQHSVRANLPGLADCLKQPQEGDRQFPVTRKHADSVLPPIYPERRKRPARRVGLRVVQPAQAPSSGSRHAVISTQPFRPRFRKNLLVFGGVAR